MGYRLLLILHTKVVNIYNVEQYFIYAAVFVVIDAMKYIALC